jgi:glutaredoxin
MFTVYSKPACPFCDQSKALLEKCGANFEIVHLDVGQKKEENAKYISRNDLISQIPTAKSMPQILHNGTPIGGFNELKKLLA